MPRHSISQKEYLKAAQYFHWATKDHFNLWLYETTARSHRTESVLARLAKKWADKKTRKYSLFATRYGKKMIYTCPRRVRNPDILHKIDHGLGVTDCLIRIHKSAPEAQILHERFFAGCGSIPDVGFKFKDTLLLVEYSSKSNFQHHNVIKNKMSAYLRNYWKIEERFGGEVIVLFVIDIDDEVLRRFLKEPTDKRFYFTTLSTFNSLDLGTHLTSSIYYWGKDGGLHPLTKNVGD